MSDGNSAVNDVLCERCDTAHAVDQRCAPLQLCPECGRNGGGIPCGHYYDAIDIEEEYTYPTRDGVPSERD